MNQQILKKATFYVLLPKSSHCGANKFSKPVESVI